MPATPSPLEKPRREIDRIDDAIHGLLMDRTAKVEKIRKLKNGGNGRAGGFLRPTREAEVLRRLVARQYLAESSEFTVADDERLGALITGDTTLVSRIRHLGGYAEPLDQS